MTTDKEFAEGIHLLIHSARLIPNYKPTELEKKVSKYVVEHFKDTCKECKERLEQSKNTQEQKGFLSKMGDVILGN